MIKLNFIKLIGKWKQNIELRQCLNQIINLFSLFVIIYQLDFLIASFKIPRYFKTRNFWVFYLKQILEKYFYRDSLSECFYVDVNQNA